MLNVSFLCSAIWAADQQCHWAQVMITITFADVQSCQILFSKMSENVIKSKPEKNYSKAIGWSQEGEGRSNINPYP